MAADETDKWVAMAKRLGRKAGPSGEDIVAPLAERLVELDKLMRAAPTKLFNAYSRIGEQRLAAAARSRQAQLDTDEWAWTLERQRDPAETIFPLAVEIRATDAYLREVRPHTLPGNIDREWRYPRVKSLVIPCRERRLGKSGRGKQPYERRGLLQHRILPERIGKFQVRLAGGGITSAVAPVGPPSFKGGAALFAGLKLKAAYPAPGLFIVESCRAPDHHEQIVASLGDAHDEVCTALVWPELTITPDDRAAIVKWLRLRGKSDYATAPALKLVVAGSWHETKDGKTFNRSVVVNGQGKKLLSFDKLVAYHDVHYGTEDIEEADRLEVLVLDEALLAFGICRDFADIKPDNPFGSLDVDFIVIPSMGNATTSSGHQLTAKIVEKRFAAQSFVVQQADPDLAKPLGFIIHETAEVSQIARFAAYVTSTAVDSTRKS